MIKAGIHSGDILVVDRSVEPKDKKVVVAVLDGDFTVKRVRKIKDKLYLISENDDYSPIEIKEESNFEIWGVVAHVIHSV